MAVKIKSIFRIPGKVLERLWILILIPFLFSGELQQCFSKTVFSVAVLHDAEGW